GQFRVTFHSGFGSLQRGKASTTTTTVQEQGVLIPRYRKPTTLLSCNFPPRICPALTQFTKNLKNLAQPDNYITFATTSLRYRITMETRRDVFQAIADPTRRAILLLIAAQAMTP